MSWKIGYARVSTEDQDLGMQIEALKGVGCEEVFEEQMSGARRDRPVLARMLERIRKGDTLVVWKTDRLARSLSHLLEVVEALNARGVNFQSITEGFDTTTPGGKAFFQICGTMAELERNLIQERVMSGLKKARAEGRIGGRPKTDREKVTQALAMVGGGMSITLAAKAAHISRSTLYRAINVSKTSHRKNGHKGSFETVFGTGIMN
jgi:DNA invertase Pin-like site-specific DNA recombinase